MRKIKKLLAIGLSMAMVMGLGLTSHAEDTKINVTNAGETARFEWVQVIQDDATQPTGWDIIDTYAPAFEAAYGKTDEQYILNEIIEKGVTDARYAKALDAVWSTITAPTADSDKTEVKVNRAGVYVIKAFETGYVYGTMAGYVGFNAAGVLQSDGINAKKVPINIVKDGKADGIDDKDITEKGKTDTFTISGLVPYVSQSDADRTYVLTDTLTGAEYVKNANGEVELTVNIKENTEEEKLIKSYKFEGTIDTTETGSKFTADLSTLLDNNQHAYKKIEVKYDAITTGTEVSNDAALNNGDFGTDSKKMYTGKIKLTKVDKDDQSKTLVGAEFVVKNDKDQYLKITTAEGKQSYSWVVEGEATTFTTDGNGVIEIDGLATGSYTFVETKAPEGYSLDNETPATVTLTKEKNSETVTIKSSRDITKPNSTLSGLPATGGIGTTIFTIGGIAIMIIAAALFFANRKKNNA